MQTHLHIEWTPAEPERWQAVIELIAEIITRHAGQMNEPSLPYRLGWQDEQGKTHHGAPLFESPARAAETKSTLESLRPRWRVWVEESNTPL